MLIPSAILKRYDGDLPPIDDPMVNGEMITTQGTGLRRVPNGVTEVVVEVFGAGGGGGGFYDEFDGTTSGNAGIANGGGGGGYLRFRFPVTPGDEFGFTIGDGAVGGTKYIYQNPYSRKGANTVVTTPSYGDLTAGGGTSAGNGNSSGGAEEGGYNTYNYGLANEFNEQDAQGAYGNSYVYPFTGAGGDGGGFDSPYSTEADYGIIPPTGGIPGPGGTSSAAPGDGTAPGYGGGGSGSRGDNGGKGSGGGVRFSW
jgi:hypothetical protein